MPWLGHCGISEGGRPAKADAVNLAERSWKSLASQRRLRYGIEPCSVLQPASFSASSLSKPYKTTCENKDRDRTVKTLDIDPGPWNPKSGCTAWPAPPGYIQRRAQDGFVTELAAADRRAHVLDLSAAAAAPRGSASTLRRTCRIRRYGHARLYDHYRLRLYHRDIPECRAASAHLPRDLRYH